MVKMIHSAQQDTSTALEDFSLSGEKNPIIVWETALNLTELTSGYFLRKKKPFSTCHSYLTVSQTAKFPDP